MQVIFLIISFFLTIYTLYLFLTGGINPVLAFVLLPVDLLVVILNSVAIRKSSGAGATFLIFIVLSCVAGITLFFSPISLPSLTSIPLPNISTLTVTTSPQPNFTPAVKPEPTSVTPSSTASKATINVSQLELQIHNLVNAERMRLGLKPMSWNEKLNAIARGHSQDMASRGYFSHTSPDGLEMEHRYILGGFVMQEGGAENIFQCNMVKSQWYVNNISTRTEYNSQDEIAIMAVSGWMGSAGHRQNILTPYWTVEGIGIAVSQSGEVLITQNFG